MVWGGKEIPIGDRIGGRVETANGDFGNGGSQTESVNIDIRNTGRDGEVLGVDRGREDRRDQEDGRD